VVGFAFTELLGFRLLPRLRNLGAMGPVLTRPIRWDLIARQLYQCTQALVTSTVRRSSVPCTAMTPPGDDPEQRGVRRHVRVAAGRHPASTPTREQQPAPAANTTNPTTLITTPSTGRVNAVTAPPSSATDRAKITTTKTRSSGARAGQETC